MKAMRKDRTRRYRSASELADDVQNYLTDAPLIAGPESTVYRARKFVRKHAGSVATAALVAVLIILGLIVSTALSFRAEKARGEEATARTRSERAEKIAEKQSKLAEKQRKLAEEQSRLAVEQRKKAEDLAENYRRALYFNRIALADISFRDGDIRRLHEQLDACPEDLRAWEWHHLNHISDQSLKTIHGHDGWKLAISPDGKHVASGGEDNTVKVWDTKTGVELMSLHSPDRKVNSVKFSPDGKQIVSGSYDGTLKVCHVENAKELMTLKAHEASCGALFSPDGTRIISGSRDGTLKVWNAETGTELRSWRAHKGRGRCHTISPDGRCIASGGNDDVIRLWDIKTGAELMVLRGHRGEVVAVKFSPDGKQIVSGSWDNTVKVWDSATGKELMTLSGHKGIIHDVAFDPHGRRIASGSQDGTVKVWDIKADVELMSFLGHRGAVTSVAFSPDGERIFSCSVDGTIKVWNSSEVPEYLRIGNTTVIGFSADWQRIVSGDKDGRIKVWDGATGTQLMTLHGPKGDMISDARFSPDGKCIFSSQIRKGTIWDAATGIELMSFRANAGYVYAAFSPDGKYVASWIAEYWDEGKDENTIKLRDAKTGKEIMTLEGCQGELWGVVFSPDSKRFASCDISGTIKVWDVETGKDTMILKHDGGVFSVTFSPDSSCIAGGTDADNTTKIWDVETGTEIMVLKGHFRGVGTLIYNPDGKRLISEGRDGRVKLWDVSTGTEVMSFGAAGLVAISPDGKTIAIADAGGITLLESEAPADGYENRRTGAATIKVVDELHEEHGLYSKVIEKLNADGAIEEPIRKIALQIANARLWEDKKKTEQ